MSLKPLDLQNLFVRLNQIGREQIARQEAPLHAQQVAAEKIAQETRLAGEKVHAPEETSSGPEKIHRDHEQEQSDNRREQAKHEDPAEEEKPDDPFRDPALGNKIDISG